MHQSAKQDQARSGDDLLARLREAESKIAALSDELARSERLATLGTTAAIVAHEFNNILTPVLSYAQIAQASRGDVEVMSDALQRTVDAVLRATEIGSSILGFVRSSSEEPEIAPVEECVRDAIRCLVRDPERDGMRMVIEVEPGLTARIRPVALQQVMLNLTLNACAAMRPLGGEIRVTAKRGSAGPGRDGVVIEVTDTGPGIPAEVAPRVFEPFVSQREGGGGSGLGLAVCRRLIEEAGGTIEAGRAESGGARFTMWLPMEKESVLPSRRPAA